jgi:uncharacterized membrane protein YfcA
VVGALFFAFVLLSTALGWLLQGINDAEWFGPLVGAVLVEIAFLVLCIWVVADAIRDRRAAREHPKIDTARLAAFAVVVVYTVAVIVLSLQPDAGEIIEALAFMLMGALGGGCAVGFADLAERLLVRKEPAPES